MPEEVGIVLHDVGAACLSGGEFGLTHTCIGIWF